MTSTATLSVCGVSKHFGGLQALRDVSLDVNRGEVVGLVGDNGAGKSTLMKIIAGVQQPSRGHVAIDGEPAEFTSPAENMRPLGGRVSPGAQHVAFSCDDAFAVSAALRAAGAPLLAIPENYYEDLQARLDLPDGAVARLLGSGMLYDRDRRGEFFHFYTALLGPRLFIEVVQRHGGYSGYGAANAPVRMAAQRALLTVGGRER